MQERANCKFDGVVMQLHPILDFSVVDILAIKGLVSI